MAEALGLQQKAVRLVPHDERWASLFAEEAARFLAKIGSGPETLVHIGSTAVSGLEAKPVLDLMLAIPSLRAPRSFYEAVEELGYEHRPKDTLEDRLFFVQEAAGLRTHHLSVCETGSRFWIEHVKFRDLLRTDRTLAAAYLKLKRELAARYPDDRLMYTNGKDDFIRKALYEASDK
jgi:GrpB-like predicted nucleotidyltransferase (UPF0157 family)